MGVDLENTRHVIVGEWRLTVDIPRTTNDPRKHSGVVFEIGTISEIDRGDKRRPRDSLVAIEQKSGRFLVQICLEEFAATGKGFDAGGTGYTEEGDHYEGGIPAWQKWRAVRRKK